MTSACLIKNTFNTYCLSKHSDKHLSYNKLICIFLKDFTQSIFIIVYTVNIYYLYNRERLSTNEGWYEIS